MLKGSIPDAPADVTNGVTGSGSDKSKVSLCIWEYKIAGIRMEVHVSNLYTWVLKLQTSEEMVQGYEWLFEQTRINQSSIVCKL